MERDSLTTNQIQSVSPLAPRKNQGFSLHQQSAQTSNKVGWGHAQLRCMWKTYPWGMGTQHSLCQMMNNKNIVYTKYSKSGLHKLHEVVEAEIVACFSFPHFSIFCSTLNFCHIHVPPVLLFSFGFYSIFTYIDLF